MTFSNILEKDVSRETGLQFAISDLFPFFNIGIIWENFSHVGNMPMSNDLLHM
jgi:hypothetical protein